MQELIGIKFMPGLSKRHPWRAQINRCNRGFYLGMFKTPQEAQRAYDNAAYYLRAWSGRGHGEVYNFPGEWVTNIPPPKRKTVEVRDRLRKLHPEKEIEQQGKKDLKDGEALEHSMMSLIDSSESALSILRKRITDSLGRVKMLESRVTSLEAEIEKRDRIIEGLQNQGGQQFFKKVEGKTVPVSAVESHMTAPAQSEWLNIPDNPEPKEDIDKLIEAAEAESEADYPND